MEKAAYHPVHPEPEPASARLPIHFFVLAMFGLCAAAIAMPAVVPIAVAFFYQAKVLALVHTVTLGFVTPVIMGVMYRFLPALMGRNLPFPRMALWQFVLYAIGSFGMISHFAVHEWAGLAFSAAVVTASTIMFAANLVPVAIRRIGKGVAETGMSAAIGSLMVAAGVGTLMGLEEMSGFVVGDLPRLLSAHVVFALVGWVAVTVCAASYRFIPAFVLPSVGLPRTAQWQISGLVIGTFGLGTCLLLGTLWSWIWAGVVSGMLVMYIALVGRLIAHRRVPVEWGIKHAIVGLVWLAVAMSCAVRVMYLGAWSESGAPLVIAAVSAALLGWVGNFVIGMSYYLFPGFVARVRKSCNLSPVTIAQLSYVKPRPFVFGAFNVGLIVLVTAFIAGSESFATLGSTAVMLGVIPYAISSLLTLRHAYYDGSLTRMRVPPRRAAHPNS